MEEGLEHDEITSREHLVEFGQWINSLDPALRQGRAPIGGDHTAAECRSAARHLAADPAEPDDPDRCRTPPKPAPRLFQPTVR